MRKTKNLILVGLTAGLCLLSMTAQAASLKLCAAEWQPYTSNEISGGGFFANLIVKALESQGHTVHVRIYPWKRALAMTKKGRCDGLIGASYTEERARLFAYPHWAWNVDIRLFGQTGRYGFFNALEDLCPAVIGLNRGSYLEAKFKKISCLNSMPVVNVSHNIKQLLAGRIDLLAEAADSVIYYLNRDFHDRNGDITALSPALETDKIYVAFSKQNPDHAALVQALDAGMKHIKKTGIYNAVLHHHGMR